MTIKAPVLILLACLACTAATSAGEASAPEAAAAPPVVSADTLQSLVDQSRDLPSAELGRLLRDHYAAGYATTGLRSLAGDDLAARFDAARVVAFYAGDRSAARELLTVMAELERRSLATRRQRQDMHASLVQARMFELARAFHDQHPGLDVDPVPAVVHGTDVGSTAPSVLAWDSDRRVLVREDGFSGARYKILVVSHPYCGFSNAAADAIDSDPQLARVFEELAVWLVAPPGELPLAGMERWQEQHPRQRIAFTGAPESWRFIDTSSTPVFYFLRDGAVMEKITGWPEEGNREALLEGLKRIGALPGTGGAGGGG